MVWTFPSHRSKQLQAISRNGFDIIRVKDSITALNSLRAFARVYRISSHCLMDCIAKNVFYFLHEWFFFPKISRKLRWKTNIAVDSEYLVPQNIMLNQENTYSTHSKMRWFFYQKSQRILNSLIFSVDLSAEKVLKQWSEVAFSRKSRIQLGTKFETHGAN